MIRMLPQFDAMLCTQCGLCAEACRCGSIEMAATGPVFHCPDVCSYEHADTVACDCLCEEVCPTGAISCAFDIVLEGGGCVSSCHTEETGLGAAAASDTPAGE